MIAYAPVVMWMVAEREGGEHRWREGAVMMRAEEREKDGCGREEGASGENAVMPGQ